MKDQEDGHLFNMPDITRLGICQEAIQHYLYSATSNAERAKERRACSIPGPDFGQARKAPTDSMFKSGRVVNMLFKN